MLRALASLALLERSVAILGVAVRAEEQPLADRALERDLPVPPGNELVAIVRRFAPTLRACKLGRQHARSVRHERYDWQRGQNQVPRPPTRAFAMVARQRRHGRPSRP